MRRWVLAIILGFILLAGGALGATVWLRSTLAQPGPLPVAKAIVVPRGGTEALAHALAEAGIIDNTLLFRAAAWISRDRGPLRAAEFAFPARASIDEVLSILRTARPVEHKVTLAEGLTAVQMRAVLARADALTGKVPDFPDGSVLPETYSYEYGTSAAAIVARAQAAMDRALNIAWTGRAPNLPLDNPREALILASIVERETAKPAERPHIAAVYLNRLREGMRLQADPTVVYAVSGGTGILDRPLSKTDLARDNPFNTYRNAGLPPGPICSPSVASLDAVLHPAASDDLYFVADGTGGHTFSRTLDTHEAAVARWRALAPRPAHGSPD
ncbi:endolytic transglycosylase MltG [Rhodopila sp.]|jgi:UPF0755 protein|uniref:endolytic transglycosylase MltG n=1 Tax=Rhodopila sp. TaxID=2480087 RepID=UPI002CD9055A|nr:endolytic transglycosylase MltG [Rhodopila sp.]HVZ07971.1 endolytic transglycosylase MltG [Rhodopila sp.]